MVKPIRLVVWPDTPTRFSSRQILKSFTLGSNLSLKAAINLLILFKTGSTSVSSISTVPQLPGSPLNINPTIIPPPTSNRLIQQTQAKINLYPDINSFLFHVFFSMYRKYFKKMKNVGCHYC